MYFSRGGGAEIQCYILMNTGAYYVPTRTYIFGNVVENVGFQWHIHVDGSSNPTEFALSYVQNPIDAPDAFTCYLELVTSQKPYPIIPRTDLQSNHPMPLQQFLPQQASTSLTARSTYRHIAVGNAFGHLWPAGMSEEDCKRRVAVQWWGTPRPFDLISNGDMFSDSTRPTKEAAIERSHHLLPFWLVRE